MTAQLRDYQRDLLDRFHLSTSPRVLVQSPVASGKTYIAAKEIADRVGRGERVLLVAHRRQLLTPQAEHALGRFGVDEVSIGFVIGADKRRRPGAPVQVATIQTLTRRDAKGMGKFDLIVVDEAHHMMADTYRRIISLWPHARVLGLTATPTRLDGKGLVDVFDELLVGPSVESLIERGVVARPRIWTAPTDCLPDVSGLGLTPAGDYAPRELAKRCVGRTIVGSIVEEWQAHAAGMSTVAFAANVEHALLVASEFSAAGIRAETLTHRVSSTDREAMIERCRRGQTSVLVTVDIFGEGVDIDTFRCAILARPTASYVVHIQQCGRVMRPGAVRPVILDHAGNMLFHWRPWDPREWSLTETMAPRSGDAPFRLCDTCGETCHVAFVECPHCGAVLREVPRTRIKYEPRISLVEWLSVAARHGVQPGTLRKRVEGGESPASAATRPVLPSKWLKYKDIAAQNGVSRGLWFLRCGRQRWEPMKAATTPPRPRRQPIVAGGRAFSSITEASKALGVGFEALKIRVKEGLPVDRPRSKGRRIDVEGISYETILEASRSIGRSSRTVLSREALAKGLCRSCRKVPFRQGKTRCAACAEKESAREKASRDDP